MMTMRRVPILTAITLLSVCAGLAALMPGTALAHERREVGKYQLVVGFQVEPAIQGEPNGPSLRVTVPSEGGKAVEGLADSLKVAVAYGGGQQKEFPLREVRSQPGSYRADFIPTRAGSYIFTFSGMIEGQSINERFESGPGRFNDVEAAEAVQFPEPVPLANEAVRTARNANDRAAEAEAAAAGARSVAMAGVGIGVVGILIGILALAASVLRRPGQAARLAESEAR
jgi:hypothetical protein